MFKEFWKIDESLGESRFAQLIGLVLLICVVAFMILKYLGGNF
jgi:hypothetical protein